LLPIRAQLSLAADKGLDLDPPLPAFLAIAGVFRVYLPEMSKTSPDIESIVRDFATRIEAVVRAQLSENLSSAFAVLAGNKTSAKPTVAEPSKAAKAAPAVAAPGKRKLKLTPKGTAARKVQGQYLGLLRGLRPGVRLRVQKVAREKGVAEAIKFASTLK